VICSESLLPFVLLAVSFVLSPLHRMKYLRPNLIALFSDTSLIDASFLLLVFFLLFLFDLEELSVD
jgi:hypothetical protein